MMKRLPFFLALSFFFSFSLNAQTIEFSDDFEAGTASWTLDASWALTTSQSNSPSNSLTDSPGGNYLPNQNSSATMTNGVDLSSALSAELSFWAIYEIEGGNFDFCYVEASANGGAWQNVATFLGTGNLAPWVEYTYSLGGYVGNNDVKIRFRFFADGGLEFDGIYIDDVTITSFAIDNAPPLLLHTPNDLYESQLGDITKTYDIIDISGIASANLTYTVDGGSPQTIAGTNTAGDTYEFLIPEQSSGSQVDYFVEAIDNSANSNTATGDTHSYIDGNHIFYDNGVVSFVQNHGPAAASGLTSAAIRFTLTGTMDLTYALIRNYTDVNRPNDDIEVHVWADAGGFPGADLITPISIAPEANLVINSPMTRVDLRPFAAQLSGLTGDVFVGYTVPSGEAWLVQTTPGVGGRTLNLAGATWSVDTDDYHFRIVTTAPSFPVDYVFTVDMSNEQVSPNGVQIAGNFNDWDPTANPLMDVGNGVWTGVVTLEANTVIEYKFLNGNTLGDAESVPSACGVDDGMAGFNRTITTTGANGIVDQVCFSRCDNNCFAAFDNCDIAMDLNALLGGAVGVAQTSMIVDNSDAGVAVSDPANGWECFGEPDGTGSGPTLDNSLWFSFTGDGETYSILTTDCNGSVSDYINDGDTQLAIYEGICGSLTPVACNEDVAGTPPQGPYPAGLDFATINGTNYFLMIDGFNAFGVALSDGEFCVEMTRTTPVGTDDIQGLNSFEVYPIPTSDFLNLEFSFENLTQVNLNVYNAIGQKILSNDIGLIIHYQNILELGNQPSGVYFINLVTENGSITRKILKE